MKSTKFSGGKPLNFAIIGSSGYVAPRHIQAIQFTNHHLIATLDPKQSDENLGKSSTDTKNFTTMESFGNFVDEIRSGPESQHLNYISVCSPNYLHYEHCQLALELGANVICEKPIVIDPRQLKLLSEFEQDAGKKIFTVLQLRFHPEILKLKKRLEQAQADQIYEVELTYIAGRGSWYHDTWKGQVEKSGGIAVNIGIHLFDLLLWLFGSVRSSKVYYSDSKCVGGFIDMERARVRWFLSIDKNDLPTAFQENNQASFRSIVVGGQKIEFSQGFSDLHTVVYQEILAGRGFGIEDARPSIELTHQIRTSSNSEYDDQTHPFLRSK